MLLVADWCCSPIGDSEHAGAVFAALEAIVVEQEDGLLSEELWEHWLDRAANCDR